MAFDGIVIANLVSDMSRLLTGGRISKIAQPEKDELLLTIKGKDGQYRLCLSANAGLPLAYLTDKNKQSPMTAPNFCMMLRKHIANGRIISVTQPDMERVIHIEIEHLDEMGDLCRKLLIIELMGKHSNIIFCNCDGMIIDSIKHISAQVSSVREVLPGRTYFLPKSGNKTDPLYADYEQFVRDVCSRPLSVSKALYSSYNGISPLIATQIAYRAGMDADLPMDALTDDTRLHLFHHFEWFMDEIRAGHFTPCIVYDGDEPIEFSSVALPAYEGHPFKQFETISEVLEVYYAQKALYSRMRQKSVDLRKIVSTLIDRTRRKYDLQVKQLADTEKREKYRIYGELINTYGYGIEEGAKSFQALNYYTNEEITIPLDKDLSAKDNAKKYFEKYNKLKRTYEALTSLTVETKEELDHLLSISNAIDISVQEEDLTQIKEELVESGYLKRKGGKKVRSAKKSQPFHYRSTDGFDMYVGKNNYQNDELTFKFATGNDWWFHAKQMPGSHVIVKTHGAEMTDLAYEQAGALAAYYSSGRNSKKVEIDYLQKKNVKKPNGAKPGFVIYYTNYSLTITPGTAGLTLCED